MSDETLDYRLDHVVALESLGAGTVELRVREVQVADDVRVLGEVTWEAWERTFAAGAFHLDDEDAPAGFEAGRPVRLRLRLRRPLAEAWDDPEEMLGSLVADERSPLRHTEAWLALEAMQDVAVPGDPDAALQIGIRTRWAGPIIG